MDKWNPSQYNRFQDQRGQPFFDLLELIEQRPGMNVIDLGCGTGELTETLHRTLVAKSTLGIDSSQAMLTAAKRYEDHSLKFEVRAIQDCPAEPAHDLIFSNAALQWLGDHRSLLAKLSQVLKSDGQLAVQMPANHDHPSHVVAARVAAEEPFQSALGGYQRKSPVLQPEEYSLLLDELGFQTQHVRLQVYLHRLESRADVIEWVKGTLLTDYEKRLTPEMFVTFLSRYREVLFRELNDVRPYAYAFKRILFWAKR